MKSKSSKLPNLNTSHFKALLIKDIVGTVQGHYTMFVLRIILPSLLLLILYALNHAPLKPYINGIPESVSASNLTLPSCYALRSDDESGGLGSKKQVPVCHLVAYYPKNQYTTEIMEYAMKGLNNSNYIGYNSAADFQQQELKLFSIEFQADFSTINSYQDLATKLSVLINYNQTYVDLPHFYSLYGDEKFAKAQPYSQTLSYATWSSFPLALQSHVLKSIMKLHSNTEYDPVYRGNVVQARNTPYSQNSAISTILFGLIFVLQSIFVVIQIQQDKQGQLDSIRLSGVTDIIYVSELFCFQMMCFILMGFFQFYTAFWLPGGNDVFYQMNKGQFILIVFIGGIYSTCLGIFIGLLAKPKATILILVFAAYIIIVLCFQIFGNTMLYDVSILPKFVLFLIRWLFPFATTMQTTAAVISANTATVVFDEKSFSYDQNRTIYTMKDFTTSKSDVSGSFGSAKYYLPSNMYILSLSIYQGFLLFFFAWVLGEYLPGNASASRPFWKLFKRQPPIQGVTWNNDKKKLDEKAAQKLCQMRQKLTKEMVLNSFKEATQNCDKAVIDKAVMSLTKEYEDEEVLIAHHIHKAFYRRMFSKQAKKLGRVHQAVQSVNMCVHKGEIFGLAGHNGAGKSTTLNILTGALKIDKGGFRQFQNDKFTQDNINNAWLNNQYSVRNDIIAVRRQLAYCPQFNTNLYAELTIYQNLKFMCRIQNIPYFEHDKIIIKILKKMNLDNWKDKKIQQLSGGMQRRVSIAMTMVNSQTKLMIMDEPSTGLDPQTKRIIWSNVKDIARNPRKIPIFDSSAESTHIQRVYADKPGIIITSHDMNELDTLCDSIQIMSDGLIVAQGTALELKQKYGSGYTLTIIAKSQRRLQSFKQAFSNHLKAHDSTKFVKEIDISGAVSTYSVSQEFCHQLGALIRYLELQIINNLDIQDYCLERTSMDEVFVNVGNIFQLANGAEIDRSKIKKQNIDTVTQEQYTIQPAVDIEAQDQPKQPLTKQDIQKILSPERYKPKINTALLLKMAKKDQLHRFGVLSYVCLPFAVLLVAFLIVNVLLVKALSSINDSLDSFAAQFDKLCLACQSLDVASIPVGQCAGFDAWGYPGICQQAKILQKQVVQPTVTWYGGDQRIWQDNTNLYDTQEQPQRVLIFDQHQLLGKSNQADTISSSQRGEQDINTFKLGQITLTKVSYKYLTMEGQPVSDNIKQQITQQLNLIASPLSTLDKFDIKPIAVQYRTSNNLEHNNFDLKYDLRLENGYDSFESSSEFDINIQNKLNKGKFVFSNLKVDHYKNCEQLVNQSLSQIDKQKEVDKFIANNTACIEMDDKYSIQDLNQQMADLVPLGFIDMDQYQNSFDNKIFKPLISSFAPSRQVFYYNQIYQMQYQWVETNNYKQLNSLFDVSKLKQDEPRLRRVPSGLPSVIKPNFLTDSVFSPQTALIDLSTRLGTAIMKNVTNQLVNIRFGVQQFPAAKINQLNIFVTQTGIVLVTALQVVATWSIIFKFGSHIVQDRETGFRRQLYLNGVGRKFYFSMQLLYTLGIEIIIQLIIYVLGKWIFQLQTFVRMDGAVYFLIALAAVISTVSMSIFLASFITKSSLYNVIGMLILLITIVTVMINTVNIASEPPAYAYFLPSIGYAMLILQSSYYGTTISDLADNALGGLLIEVIIYSLCLGVLGIFIDSVFSVNGFRTMFMKKQEAVNTEKDEFDGPLGAGLGDELKTEQISTNILDVEENVPFGHTQLNKFDASQFKIKSPRDEAAFHQLDRMDRDVFRERQILEKGISKNTPVVVSNIAKKFGDFLALRDLSFHIPASDQGCVFALLGPNGAAKTTTINLMTGLMQSDAGAIHLHGFNMNDQKQAEQAYKHIGLCSQFDVYLTELSVRDHLKLFAAIHGVKWSQIDEIVIKLAEFVCLGEVLDKQVGQLSGGMRRRLSLALAIIG
ncbi:ABC_transporter family protein [Hexamita inflata]|uniref:ABC transporter family protein n=1 Tax=Hexamita inflata TaxID=28002 RepID=A0AA86PF87_9EUKA|nr:ABC transporter family protein [Hexamita inflata]CAI9934669.1 ABC transporter family protein [Hexamita inflata]